MLPGVEAGTSLGAGGVSASSESLKPSEKTPRFPQSLPSHLQQDTVLQQLTLAQGGTGCRRPESTVIHEKTEKLRPFPLLERKLVQLSDIILTGKQHRVTRLCFL